MKNNTLNYIKYLLPAAAMLLIVVFIAVSVSAMGAKLVDLEEQKQSLQNDNRLLKAELVEKSSLSKMEERAGEYGLAQADNVVYLNSGEAVAQLP